MNTNREKMIKMSKILSVILKVCAIVLAVSLVVILLFAILAPSFNFNLDQVQVDFLNTNMPFNDFDGIRVWMLDMVIAGVVIIAILFIAGNIFKAINREGTPFTKRNSDKIRIIALLLIAIETLIPALQLLVTLVFFPNTHASASFALGNLIVAAVFFCLALIFDYGRQLQQESDETL